MDGHDYFYLRPEGMTSKIERLIYLPERNEIKKYRVNNFPTISIQKEHKQLFGYANRVNYSKCKRAVRNFVISSRVFERD